MIGRGGIVLDFMVLNLPCDFFFNQHTTQATPNTDVDDNCKMFKKLSRDIVILKNVEVGELNILRATKPSCDHEHLHIHIRIDRHAIIAMA